MILAVQLVLLTVLRFSFRNHLEVDTYILLFYSLLMTGSICYLLFFMDTALLGMEKNVKEKRYYLSLPVSKRQYVAEKYLFLLIAMYAIYSLLTFEGFICQTFCEDTVILDETGMLTIYGFMVAFQGMLLPLLSIVLFIASLDFGFMMYFGVQRGQRLKMRFLSFVSFCLWCICSSEICL